MTNDKALEAAYAVAGNACKTCQGGDACNGFECRIAFEAAISAYFSALPGEAEVVAWTSEKSLQNMKDGFLASAHWTNEPYKSFNVGLVTLASFQAMQARAEAAEALVEKAFRDGLAYGSNTENADPDVAWAHSRVRKATREGK